MRASVGLAHGRLAIASFTAVSLLSACAPTLPALTHGSATPAGRIDLAAGGSARLVIAGLAGDPLLPASEQSPESLQGVAPLVVGRVGLAPQWDASLMVVGTTARLALHREIVLDEGLTRHALLLGVAPHGGWAPSAARRTSHLGAELLGSYSVDFGRLYEVWIGPRLGLLHLWDRRLDGGLPTSTRGWGVCAGGFLGLALGPRVLQAFVELAATYEHFFLERDLASASIGGLVLTPTFGFRLRP